MEEEEGKKEIYKTSYTQSLLFRRYWNNISRD